MERCFIGAEIECPWEKLPPHPGRELLEEDRHITFAFIGKCEDKPQIPSLPFQIGPAGVFDRVIFLRRLVAYHANFFVSVENFQKELIESLKEQRYMPKNGVFLPHVTLARSIQRDASWEKWLCCKSTRED